jgi:hypothetical protein
MNFIKNAFDKKDDTFTHLQFQKFSRGEFRNRALIKAKRAKDKITIITSAEFANEMVREVAEELGNSKTEVTGAVVSTNDLAGELNFKEKKQFQGVKRYILKNEMSGNEIINLLNKFPKTFFALSFESNNSQLKIKPKAPTSGKPGKGDESPKPNFCKLITTNKKFGESFVFEKPDFKDAEISHKFIVTDLIIPSGEKDYAKMREMSKRKGKIIRKAIIDSKETNQEFGFEA